MIFGHVRDHTSKRAVLCLDFKVATIVVFILLTVSRYLFCRIQINQLKECQGLKKYL